MRSNRVKGSRGDSLIEFALVLPLLLLLIINVVNFGGMLHAWVAVSHAARVGAQYWMTGTASYRGQGQPTVSQVTSVVQQDLYGLPNATSATIVVCINNNGTVRCTGGTAAPPIDPEPTYYILGSVDVTYTYTPLISAWDFSALGVHLTLPPLTIHRQCSMRLA